MAFIVEDGSIVEDANSYATSDQLESYAEDRGTTLATGDSEAALVRATAALDAMYRGQFPGYKTGGRSQNLEWPRTAAYDIEDFLIASDEIPKEVIAATCEMAIRELTTPGSMMPDLERGGGIRSIRAGSVAIEYGADASVTTTFQLIDGLLAGLLGGNGDPSFVGTSSRA